MRRILLSSLLISLVGVAAPSFAQNAIQTDSQYLRERAASLDTRIDAEVRHHRLKPVTAKRYHGTMRQVQAQVARLDKRKGMVSRTEADRMNQQLTDVERPLTHQD